MTRPRLSVVVPVHNGERWIGDTLESLLRQTVVPPDVVVVDDGSTDGSIDLAERHQLSARVVALGSNRGVAFARNTGLLRARGDFVAFLDQDDLWLPNRFERLTDALAADPQRQVLVTPERVFAAEEDRRALESAPHPFLGWVEFWRPRTEVLSLLTDVAGRVGPPELRALPTQQLLAGSVTMTTSYVLPRVLSLQVGGFATWLRSADDWLLLQALSQHTPIYRLDEPSVLYRIHPQNTSVSTDWPMPLMVAAAAARFGGGFVPRGLARDPRLVGPLLQSGLLMHHLTMQASTRGVRARFDSWAAWQLLATDRRDRALTRRRLVSVMGRSVATETAKRLRGLVRGDG